MAKIRVRNDWVAESEIAYVEFENGNRTSYRIGRGETAWITVPDNIANQFDTKKFEVVMDSKKEEVISKVEEVKPVEKVKETKQKEDDDDVIVKVSKQKPGLLSKLLETAGDLIDDGKRNYSNNKTKKSPGRKKK